MIAWLKRFAICVCVPVGMAMADGDCTPPPNETCDGAVVFGNDDLPYSVTAPLGCVNDIVDRPYFDVFYRFDCSCTGEYTLDMCDSSGDTYIRIYTGACGWTGGSEFAVGDDECPGSPPNADPMITVHLEADETYWIELGTWRPDPPWAPPLNSPYNFNVSLCSCTPPAITVQPVDQERCPGGSAVFGVTADGAAPLEFQWRHNGVPIAGATSSELIVDGVEVADEGDYDVVVSDDCDFVLSESARLTLTLPGDFDADGAVGPTDFAGFVGCISGPDAPYIGDCACGDGNQDGDVDFADFAPFQSAYTGG